LQHKDDGVEAGHLRNKKKQRMKREGKTVQQSSGKRSRRKTWEGVEGAPTGPNMGGLRRPEENARRNGEVTKHILGKGKK